MVVSFFIVGGSNRCFLIGWQKGVKSMHTVSVGCLKLINNSDYINKHLYGLLRGSKQ